jgi:hypothetical protein
LAFAKAGLPTSAAALADRVAATVKDVDIHSELQANGFGAVHQQMQRPVPAPKGAGIEPALADMLVGGVGSGALPFHPAHVSIQVAVPAATTALMAAAVAAATTDAGAGAAGAGAGARGAPRYKYGMTVSVHATRKQKTADKKRQRADKSEAEKGAANAKRRAKRQQTNLADEGAANAKRRAERQLKQGMNGKQGKKQSGESVISMHLVVGQCISFWCDIYIVSD